ncbi:MAG: sensor domain-containing diguanylate cyclase [Actinobacteria bacterium]|nr:sensor domain-containing diguanylate cyclase [Actinomycetota bacterium]
MTAFPGLKGEATREFDFSPYADFSAACDAVLTYLRQRVGFSLWVVTRTDGEDWIVLQSRDEHYGIHPGDVFRWAESLCVRMAEGVGPHVAPRIREVPAYVTAEFARRFPIEAYIGVPLTLEDGSLFGTLCAFDPVPQPADVAVELPTVKMLARLLSSMLSQELHVSEDARRTERTQVEAEVDAVTDTVNREGWERLLGLEEERCLRYGHAACVVSVDLDDFATLAHEGAEAIEDVLHMTAAALRHSCRANDVVAHVGDDEFAVLAVECDFPSGGRLLRRIERALIDRGIKASIGIAVRDPQRGLDRAWRDAQKAMFERKRTRSARRA